MQSLSLLTTSTILTYFLHRTPSDTRRLITGSQSSSQYFLSPVRSSSLTLYVGLLGSGPQGRKEKGPNLDSYLLADTQPSVNNAKNANEPVVWVSRTAIIGGVRTYSLVYVYAFRSLYAASRQGIKEALYEIMSYPHAIPFIVLSSPYLGGYRVCG